MVRLQDAAGTVELQDKNGCDQNTTDSAELRKALISVSQGHVETFKNNK